MIASSLRLVVMVVVLSVMATFFATGISRGTGVPFAELVLATGRNLTTLACLAWRQDLAYCVQR